MLPTFLALLAPSLLLGAACLFFLGGTFAVPRRVWGQACLGVLFAAAIALAWGPGPVLPPASFILQDSLAIVFQWVALFVAGLFAVISLREQEANESAAEFYGLLLTLAAGLMLVAAANELVLLFLGLELISVPTYVLLYLGRRDQASQESAIKYFLLSVLSASVLLYGFSFIYGLTGTTNLTGIREVLSITYDGNHVRGSHLGVIAMVLVFAGLGFKAAAVPFHFYAPDVYQGTTPWNAGLLAVAPKLAAFTALIRVGVFSMVGFEGSGETVALILAMFTMTVGNVLALLQTNIRRLLAYSSIAHAGYMLIGIAVGFWSQGAYGQAHASGLFGLPGGVQACLFYLISYSLVTAGLFAVLVYVGRPEKPVESIEELTGLWRGHPAAAICAAIFLFSLAGLPPLPGFWGKLAVFGSALNVRSSLDDLAVDPKFIVLAIVGAINAAIGAVYYLRLIAVMFLYEPLATLRPAGGQGAKWGVLVSAAATVLLGLQIGPLLTALRSIDVPPSPSVVSTAPPTLAPAATATVAK